MQTAFASESSDHVDMDLGVACRNVHRIWRHQIIGMLSKHRSLRSIAKCYLEVIGPGCVGGERQIAEGFEDLTKCIATNV